MKRSKFFNYILSIGKETPFEMTYLKKNGETRNAKCKLRDKEADLGVKGTGMTRQEKMDKLQVFQYFDLGSNAYRSARLENIKEIIVEGKSYKLED